MVGVVILLSTTVEKYYLTGFCNPEIPGLAKAVEMPGCGIVRSRDCSR